MEYIALKNLFDYLSIIEKNDVVLVYFSHETCNVCKVLKPKIKDMILKKFPKIKLYYTDTVKTPEIAAQKNVFSVPTILCYFEGKETFRKSRNIGIEELEQHIQRPYNMIFEA